MGKAGQQGPATYVLTLKEKGLTTRDLVSKGFTDVQLPNMQLVSLTARPLFFNATGVVFPGTLQKISFSQLPTANGLVLWVIVAMGGLSYELRIGRPRVRLGHPELADGWPVYAAGQVTFSSGVITCLDNMSGHYAPAGISSAFVEGVFNSDGINASGQYLELIFP